MPVSPFGCEEDMDKMHRVAIGMVLWSLMGTAVAQESGRPQDGFYSGQSNSQYNGQANGQIDSRVDGRANRNEGAAPAAGDASKQNQIMPDRSSPTNAEAMDSVVRPGLQR
jgi:hypothetical protein